MGFASAAANFHAATVLSWDVDTNAAAAPNLRNFPQRPVRTAAKLKSHKYRIQSASTPGTLEARAVVRELAQAVQHEIHDLLAYSVIGILTLLSSVCLESQQCPTEVDSE